MNQTNTATRREIKTTSYKTNNNRTLHSNDEITKKNTKESTGVILGQKWP